MQGCRTDLDCVLAGDCVDGQCVCDDHHTGPNCQYYNLHPAEDPDIEGFADERFPSWGGKSIYADGQYHFISTYIVGQCDIYTYNTQSAFLRATGPTPMGPFTFAEEVFPPFHHGAQVERTPSGEIVIFGDGRVMPESTVKTNCKRGAVVRGLEAVSETVGAVAESLFGEHGRGGGPNLYPYGNSPNDVHFAATSNSIEGPWDHTMLPDLQTDVSNIRAWNCNKTNLAPLILKNGTVIMGYRSKNCIVRRGVAPIQHQGIAVSHNGVKGPYELRPEKLEALSGNEDAFLYQGKRGYFMVMHGKKVCGRKQSDINTCGTLGYSRDTFTWYLSPFAVYRGRVEFAPHLNKAPETLALRHRPKITFNNEGVPLVLYNSGQRDGHRYVRGFAFKFKVPEENFKEPPPCPPKPYENVCTSFTRRGNTYSRTRLGCEMFAPRGCNWCEEEQTCMPGFGDESICKASSAETFYAHC